MNRASRPGFRIFLLLGAMAVFSFGGVVATLLGGTATAYAAYAYVTKDLPDPTELANRPLAQVTQIFDRSGEHLLYEFYEERRIAIPIAEVAPVMINATLAIEDAKFFQHHGFDVQGLARAFISNFHTGQIVGG